MNKPTIALLIPLYPPHFKRADALLDSVHQHMLNEQADVYFVFSNETEAASYSKKVKKIILPEDLRLQNNKGIINIKKFYGLRYLGESYNYIIVLDAESQFVRNCNLEKICKSFFRKKEIYGNTPILDVAQIQKSCKRFFEDSQRNLLDSYDELYFWFNQPCIYSSANLKSFFSVTHILDQMGQLCYFDFDYYIYIYYLILYEGFKVVDLQAWAPCGLCESYAFIQKYGSDISKFYPAVCNPRIYTQINNESVVLFIQLNAGVREDDDIISYGKSREFFSFVSSSIASLRRKLFFFIKKLWLR